MEKKSRAQISGGGVCDLWTLGPRDALMIYAMQFSLKLYSVKLFMKEGSLFCSYEIHSTRTGMLQIMFLVSLESSWLGGVHGLGFMRFRLVVQKVLE
jgi:hypothetical protein